MNDISIDLKKNINLVALERERKNYRQIDRKTERQKYRKAERQKDRKTERQLFLLWL